MAETQSVYGLRDGCEVALDEWSQARKLFGVLQDDGGRKLRQQAPFAGHQSAIADQLHHIWKVDVGLPHALCCRSEFARQRFPQDDRWQVWDENVPKDRRDGRYDVEDEWFGSHGWSEPTHGADPSIGRLVDDPTTNVRFQHG